MSLANLIHVTIINATIITEFNQSSMARYFSSIYFHLSNISRLLWPSFAFLWFKWDHLALQNLPKYELIGPQSAKYVLQLVPKILNLYGDSHGLI